MGNACCNSAEPEKPATQSEGELAGKAKFLSTPSFCELTDNSGLFTNGPLAPPPPSANAAAGSLNPNSKYVAAAAAAAAASSTINNNNAADGKHNNNNNPGTLSPSSSTTSPPPDKGSVNTAPPSSSAGTSSSYAGLSSKESTSGGGGGSGSPSSTGATSTTAGGLVGGSKSDVGTTNNTTTTNNNNANAPGAASGLPSSGATSGPLKWFLCVFAPLNGQGLAFTAYQAKTNTLMVKYLTDSEIVREKETQNISITYNMFFKALSTEVARAGRVGAKVTFMDTNTVSLDCKIMIAGATSRRPDNFHVELKRVETSPEKLYSFVIEPVCTQYYKRRANEGWNVERVDVSREKIYGEYETNFVLRSHRMEQNLEMLRDLVPRVLQLRRERMALRERRDSLLAQLAVARTLMASGEAKPPRLIAALSDKDKAQLLGNEAVDAARKRTLVAAPSSTTTTSAGAGMKESTDGTHPSSQQHQLSRSRRNDTSLYPTYSDPNASAALEQPTGVFLSSLMPNASKPIPAVIPESGGPLYTPRSTSMSNNSGNSGSNNNNNNANQQQQQNTTNQGNNNNNSNSHGNSGNNVLAGGATDFPSLQVIELCIALGSRIDIDLRRFEQKHPPAALVQGPGLYTSSPTHHELVSLGGAGSSMFNNSGAYSLGTTGGGGRSPGMSPARHPGGASAAAGEVYDPFGNDAATGFSLDGTSFAVPSDDYFVFDFTLFPDDIQSRFSKLPTDEEKSAVFRCWRSFVSVSRFDAFIVDLQSGGHACAIALAMALSMHGVVADLKLSVAGVHDLCSRLEAIQSRTDQFFNSTRAADRVQFMSLFLKVIQSGTVPRLQGVPAIEKLCTLVAAVGCRADIHPPQEPYAAPHVTLAALHIDSVNERHALAVTVAALRQSREVAKFVTPTFHMLLSDLMLSLDPARHNTILTSFLYKIRAANNFSRSLVERRLMLSILLIGADCAFFARAPAVKEQWSRRLDNCGLSGYGNASNSGNNNNGNNNGGARLRLRRFSGGNGNGGGGDSPGRSPYTLADLRSPLKINLPSTFRIGAASGFGGGGGAAGIDDVAPSCLVLKSETYGVGGFGRTLGGGGGMTPSCMQGITKKSHEVYESIVTPVFSCLRTLAQESLDATKRASADNGSAGGGSAETVRDSTYSVFSRIAQCGLYG